MRRSPLLVTGALLPLGLAFIAWQVALSRAATPDDGWVPSPSAVTVTFLDHSERQLNRHGQITGEFQAGRLDVLSNGDYTIQDLEQGVWQRGENELLFRADNARLEAISHDLALSGKVVARGAAGLTLRAPAAFYFQSEDKLFVPELEQLDWPGPPQPDGSPATGPAVIIRSQRLFLWPGQGRLDLPDPLTAIRGEDQLVAEAASALAAKGQIALLGPATLTAKLAGDAGPRPLLLTSDTGGQITYNTTSGAATMAGGMAAQLPTDGVRLTAATATYSGHHTRTLELSGRVGLNDPSGSLTAERGRVTLANQRAAFSGNVTFDHVGESGPLSLRAHQVIYDYAPSARRAAARGDVALSTNEADATAPSLSVNLHAETAALTGGVHLRTKPGALGAPASGDAVDQALATPVDVYAQAIDHSYRRGARWMRARGRVRYAQVDSSGRGDREGSSDHLRLDQEQQVLVLEGNVNFRNQAGERARCGKLTYNLRAGTMLIERPISAELHLSDEDLD